MAFRGMQAIHPDVTQPRGQAVRREGGGGVDKMTVEEKKKTKTSEEGSSGVQSPRIRPAGLMLRRRKFPADKQVGYSSESHESSLSRPDGSQSLVFFMSAVR